MNEHHYRSIVKGATWRAIGTIDTIMLSLLFTGKIGKALTIGGIEVFTKILLFWLHERMWMQLSFGQVVRLDNGHRETVDEHYRSIIKGISWRIIGSIDTFWIALVVNHESPFALQTAFYIAATEVLTKVFLYWLHERAWLKVAWGKVVVQ